MYTVSTGALLEMRIDPLTQHHILKIKDDVGTCWRDAGVKLEIEEGILENTDQDYKSSREKAHHVLNIWTQQKGKEATVGSLARVLIAIGHKRIAEKLLGR